MVAKNKLIRLTNSKITDLKDIKSPKNKDQLRSILGIISWYSNRTPVKDLAQPLRAMAKAGVRFKWGEVEEKALRDTLGRILCPITGCLRPAISASPKTPYVIYSDSSRYSLGGVLCQRQKVGDKEISEEKLDPETYRIYLIQYFAKMIKSNELLTPIAILELESLFQCLKHWKFLIYGGARTICFTDSRYVSYWLSLELCSEKVARMLLEISEYDIEIRFLPSELNQSDIVSRALLEDLGETPTAQNPFFGTKVYNAIGEIVRPEFLFSESKRKEMNHYFKNRKRGKLAKVLNIGEWVGKMRPASQQVLGGGPQDRGTGCFQAFEAASESHGQISPAFLMSSEGATTHEESRTGGGSHPTGYPRIVRGGRTLGGRGLRGPFPVSRGTRVVSCPTSTTLLSDLPGAGDLGGIQTLCNPDDGASSGGLEAIFRGGIPRLDIDSLNCIDNYDISCNLPERASGRRKARARRKARRRDERMLKAIESVRGECANCACEGLGGISEEHCTCMCGVISGLEAVSYVGMILVGKEGEEEEEEGDALCLEDPFVAARMPELSSDRLEKAKKGQESENMEKLRMWIMEIDKRPNKQESLQLGARQLSLLRHISLFKISSQNVIYRIFVKPDGKVSILLVIDGDGLDTLIDETHEALGHGGGKSVFEILKASYYSPGLRDMIKNRLSKCGVCLKYNIPKTVHEKKSTLLATQSQRVLQLDMAGPLPASFGCKYIFAAIDSYDRRCFLRGAKGTSGDEMCCILMDLFSTQGLWECLKMDSRCLTYKGWDKILTDRLGVKIVRSVYCSRQQGQVERLIQTATVKLLKVIDKADSLEGWVKALPKVEFMINSSPSAALGFLSPNEVAYRRPPTFFAPLIEKTEKEGVIGEGFNQLVAMSDEIRLAAYRTLRSNKHFYYPNERLSKGQIMFRKRQSFSRHQNKKLQLKILEAYKVESRVGTGMYQLRNLEDNSTIILPCDQLIRTNLNESEAKKLISDIKSKS